MTIKEREELVDMIAQAVIDKIEERDRVNRIADLVVARVLELQEEESTLYSTVEDDNFVAVEENTAVIATSEKSLEKPSGKTTQSTRRTAKRSRS